MRLLLLLIFLPSCAAIPLKRCYSFYSDVGVISMPLEHGPSMQVESLNQVKGGIMIEPIECPDI